MPIRLSRIFAIVSLVVLAVFFISLSSGSTISAAPVVPDMQLDPPDPPPDDVDMEPPADPPPPREWVMLELEVVTPETVNAGLRQKTYLVVKVHNRGNIPAEDVVVSLDGVSAFEAPIERIRAIPPGRYEIANLNVEFLGRFAEPHIFAVRAEAANSEIPVYDYAHITFAPLGGSQYFDDDSHIVLKAERLPQDRYRTFQGYLLRFELSSGRRANDPLEIDLSSLLNPAERSEGKLTFYYKALRSRNTEVPITFDEETAIAVSTLPGEGEYALRWQPKSVVRDEGMSLSTVSQTTNDQDYIPSGWVPTFHAPNVAEFSGAVTYDYPMVVPPGPNGLQPPLSLVYSSSHDNGLMGDFQGDPVGFGWTLSSHVDIVQSLFAGKDALRRDCGGNNACLAFIDLDLNQSTEVFYNQYTLNFHGQGHELIHSNGRESNGQIGRYYAAGDAGIYVELCKSPLSSACANHGSIPGTGQESKAFWIIKTPDNTTYRLGHSNNSEQEIFSGHADSGVTNKALKWRVDTVTDRFGNNMTYSYIEDNYSWFTMWDTSTIHTPASYLKQIDYNNSQIVFNYENIPEDRYGDPNDVLSWQTKFLTSIEVKQQGQLLKEYKLYHDWARYGNGSKGSAHPLQSTECAQFPYRLKDNPLVEFVPDEVNMLAAISELVDVGGNKQGRACTSETACEENPDRSFEYTFELGGYADTSAKEHYRFCAPLMTAFETLYGPVEAGIPTASFEYSPATIYPGSDYRLDGQWPYYRGVEKQTVYSNSVDDAPNMETHYQYGNANFEGVSNAFQGFDTVTRYDGDDSNGNWLRKTVTTYWAEPYHEDDSTRTGKIKTETTHDSGGEIFQAETIWTMLHYAASGASGVNTNSRHAVVSENKTTDKRSGGAALTRSVYKYDKYGNRTQLQEFGERTTGNPYRTLETLYVYNTNVNGDRWLVNLPWRETMWDDVPDTTIVRRNRYRYDGANCNQAQTQVPDEGRLHFMDQYESSSPGANADPNRDGGVSYNCGADWLTTNYYYGNTVHQGQDMGETWQLTRVLDPGGIKQDTKWLDKTRIQKSIDYVGSTQFETILAYSDSYSPWLVTQVTAANWANQAFEYDPFGRLLTIKSPDPGSGAANQVTQHFVYHDTGNPLYIDVLTPDPNGGDMTERTFYDPLGRPLQKRSWDISSDFTQSILDMEYDKIGRLECEIVPIGGTYEFFSKTIDCTSYDHTTTSYDALDSIIQVVEPGGQTTDTEYGNRQKKVTDGNNNTTTYTQDVLGRLKSIQEPGTGGITNYTYDLADNLTAVYAADGSATSMVYNNLGQKVSMDDADMGIWSYAYDASGNLVRQTDAKNKRTCFYYDSGGRLTDKRYDGSGTGNCPTNPGGSNLGTYTYHSIGEGRGQVQSINYINTNYQDDFTYDYRGRITEMTRTIDGRSYTLETQYDNLDRPVRKEYPNGDAVDIIYDGQFLDKLNGTVDGVTSAVITGQAYNSRLQQTAMYRPGSVPNTNFIYHSVTKNYRLQHIKNKDFATDQWADFEYNYDNVGNITNKNIIKNGSYEREVFTYDALNRLDTATATNSPNNYTYDYGYDAGGNLKSRNGTGGTLTYQYFGDLGQEPFHGVKSISGGMSADFTYDLNGNMTSRVVDGVTYSQSWNGSNSLQSVTVNGQWNGFTYDPDGRRVVTQLPGSVKIYTPWPDYEEEISGSDTIQRMTYTLGDRLIGVQVSGHPDGSMNGRFYFFTDHLGSVSYIVNSGGQLRQDIIRYGPFGSYRGSPPDGTNPDISDRGFTGQKHQNELDLIYYNARWYMAEIGRFLSPDSIVPDPMDPQSLNRYTYSLNNPIYYTDPTGHAECASYDCNLLWHPVNGNVVVREASSPLYALIQLFSSSNLSANAQLENILNDTMIIKHFQFAGLAGSRGDAGFQAGLQDDQLYSEIWNTQTPASRQVGHFLTAVSLGYYASENPWDQMIRLWSIVRHEQYSDTTSTVKGVARQILPLSNTEIDQGYADIARFLASANADATGKYEVRDAILGDILDPTSYGPLDNRIGNSMQDLRLSARGWNLGRMAAGGGFQSSNDVANWLALYVAGN